MVSLAQIKHIDPKKLEVGKGLFQFILPGNSPSLREVGQEPGAETVEESCLLALSLPLTPDSGSQLVQYSPDLPVLGPLVGSQFLTGMALGQLD